MKIPQHCPNLELLEISYCAMTDAFLSQLAQRQAQRCPRISSSRFAFQAYEYTKNVTAAGLEELAGLKELTHLQIDDKCEPRFDYSGSCFEKLLRGCPKLHPDKLGSGCKGDMFLTAVARTRGTITKLDLERSSSSDAVITDAGLGSLAQGCPHLVHLCLRGCDEITDAGLGMLAAGCPSLKLPTLIDCYQITDVGEAHFDRSP